MRLDEKRIPWVSAISLLYPIAAVFYISLKTPANVLVIAGYGISNLGYLLIAAGILRGTFKIFRLQKRIYVLISGATSLLVGFVLTNIGFL